MIGALADIHLRKKKDLTVTVGFDGYVDSIIKVVKQVDEDGKMYFKTMKCFGEYIINKAQKSCSLELKVIKEKSGGNMPIFSKALSNLGVKVNCIGALGYPTVLPIFENLGKNCTLYSVSNPGTCQALEFEDGKLMLATNDEIEKLDYDTITKRLPIAVITDLLEQSDMLTFLNWSELSGSTSIWKGLLENAFPQKSCERKHLFIDLSDCSHRLDSDILEMLELIKQFTQKVDVTLSLNLNEAERLAFTIGITSTESVEILDGLYQTIHCKRIIIHLTDGSYCREGTQVFQMKNHYIEKPKLLTGGGDNFNAGFVFGYLNGYDIEESLCIANAVSGYYVSHGHSPTYEQLSEWADKNKCIKGAY